MAVLEEGSERGENRRGADWAVQGRAQESRAGQGVGEPVRKGSGGQREECFLVETRDRARDSECTAVLPSSTKVVDFAMHH